jgi:hypothetical protein
MTRRRYIYVNGEAHEVSQDWTPEPRSDIHIMGDITPYQSMLNGEIITSRSRHREHLRDHGCVEVGNDSSLYRPREPLKPRGVKESVIAATNQIEERMRRGR